MAFKLCLLCAAVESPLIGNVKADVYATINYYLVINISYDAYKGSESRRVEINPDY